MKKRIVTHLQYGWWIYLLIAVVTTVIWLSLYDSLTKLSPDEKFTVVYVGKELNVEQLDEKITDKLKDSGYDRIKEVYVENAFIEDEGLLDDLIAARALGDTDLMIFSESTIPTNYVESYAAHIDKQEALKRLGQVVFYEDENAVCGVLVYDGVAENKFSEVYGGDEKIWAFFTINSENTAQLNDKGIIESDSVFAIIAYLTEVQYA